VTTNLQPNTASPSTEITLHLESGQSQQTENLFVFCEFDFIACVTTQITHDCAHHRYPPLPPRLHPPFSTAQHVLQPFNRFSPRQPPPNCLSAYLLVTNLPLMGLTRGQRDSTPFVCERQQAANKQITQRVRCLTHITYLSHPALLRLWCSCTRPNQSVINAVQAQHRRSTKALNEGGGLRDRC